MSTTHATHWRRGGGFTLMELLVVIGVIGLVATLAVPSIAAFMSGGAESQAVNYLSAICTAARTEALRAHNHVAVHIQMEASYIGGSWVTNLDGRCYVMVLGYDKTTGTFRGITQSTETALGSSWPHRGAIFLPKPLPGGLAFGEYSSKYVDLANNKQDIINMNTLDNVGDFTSLTILFTPSGAVGRNAPSTTSNVAGKIKFSTSDSLFGGSEPLWMSGTANYDGTGEPGVSAVFLFKAAELAAAPNNAGRNLYIQNNAQRLAINNHTGQLFALE
ncbi:MAG TPA: prepilin-type N-terminal cleavage/methylation domain-containing protein [Phycisphaerae bacterium]|nr:prepilin-type N-terminal cleavage/methylation domain-containing protein [Phycisphaerae bacterium]HQL72218.1 prepilin-type N-terminal cleavage/methylation domain-containing protein [Phycisphaerae bacterium]